ncbi:hypothetical protein ABZ490_29275 [Streptomyces sp. NPDC005811]|uniref:hypothetical protein n=1 Tax=Streptomyces sp. NPDC005811 TaxID=3154565 RepID=UPI0033C5C9F2
MLGVARAAGVSNWLVYQPEIKEYIENARKGQTRKAAQGEIGRPRASAAGLAVDLELARGEIRTLREERDHLKGVVRRNLGQQLDQAGTGDLIKRVNELLAANQRLEDQPATVTAVRDELGQSLEAAMEEVATVRMAMTQIMRDANR